jgi:hypothetical protein
LCDIRPPMLSPGPPGFNHHPDATGESALPLCRSREELAPDPIGGGNPCLLITRAMNCIKSRRYPPFGEFSPDPLRQPVPAGRRPETPAFPAFDQWHDSRAGIWHGDCAVAMPARAAPHGTMLLAQSDESPSHDRLGRGPSAPDQRQPSTELRRTSGRAGYPITPLFLWP